jgi:hypothetical protein
MVDLMIRDETSHVINRATNRTSNRGAVAKPKAAAARTSVATATKPAVTGFAKQPMHRDIDGYDRAGHVVGPLISRSMPKHFSTPFVSMPTPSSSGPPSSSSSTSSPAPSTATDDAPDNSLLLQLRYPLSRTLQERGTAFFFSRYVAVDYGCYQNYDFIYDIWKPPSSDVGKVDCVTASMTAVGLAGLSKVTRCADTMVKARQSYGTAIQLVNNALADPSESVKDQTMLSVLILSTYEFITGRTAQTMRNWKNHVNGAAALTRMRGTAPFFTKAGTRMFLMLCHSLLISCIQGGLPVPEAMLNLRDELAHFTNIRDPTWRMFEPICRALQIRLDIKSGKFTDTDEIVAKLSDVENEFAIIVNEMPRSWRYKCAHVRRPNSAILGNWVHIYPGFAQATAWNGMRTMRILVQETILEQLCSSLSRQAVPSRTHLLLLVKSMRMLEMLGESVLASVPQHFGIVSSREATGSGSRGQLEFVSATRPPQAIATACPIPFPRSQRQLTPDSPGGSPRPTLLDMTQSGDGRGDAERFMTLASASNTIVWPLYTLGMSSSCTAETKEYIIGRLDTIHMETGLEQARQVKALLEAKSGTLPWDKLALTDLPTIPDNALPEMV